MKNRTQILILFLLLLVLPTSTVLACGNSSEREKTEEPSCSKQDNHSEKKSCCNKGGGDHGCNGACDNTSCHCPSSIHIPAFFSDFEVSSSTNFMLLDNDWAYVQHLPLAVYLSIWQPPKIS